MPYILRRPCSDRPCIIHHLSPMKLTFHPRNEDLVCGYQAVRDQACRPGLRFVAGVLWLAISAILLIDVARGGEIKLGWRELPWFLVWWGTFWWLAVSPVRERRRLRKGPEPDCVFEIEVGESGISVTVPGEVQTLYPWADVAYVIKQKCGYVFKFRNGYRCIPTRAFESARQVREFESVIRIHVRIGPIRATESAGVISESQKAEWVAIYSRLSTPELRDKLRNLAEAPSDLAPIAADLIRHELERRGAPERGEGRAGQF